MSNVPLICFLLSFIIAIFGKNVRIIGGDVSDNRQFPYLVSFRVVSTNAHVCGGTIISTKHILSVAHCIHRNEEHLHRIKAYMGFTNLTLYSGSSHEIKSVAVHPNYAGDLLGKNGFHNDISVVTVQGTIMFNAYQNKIDLPLAPVVKGDEVILCGWGLTSYPSNTYPTEISYVSVQLVDRKRCSKSFTFPILLDQICSHVEGYGACIGDSGGPVIKDNKVVGIISFSIPCATDAPDIHTDVFTHLHFIHSIIYHN